ncbi:hypothetical protein [Antarctobacter heliothermus]|uniref:Uncharacterized protein n=1 Tax=Antarctobacter heliothermus TaxID=74033 RepID=A0A239HIW1_9RHOB|nr:hypothetical protein [Antarctobacter heliothermus]SNS81287.1 hypothetical protein SAMN04488078_103432 [Antarctobacter heliothermus]
MNKIILSAIVVVGGAVGYMAGGLIWAPPPRDKRIATLFEEVCVTQAFGEELATPPYRGLVRIKSFEGMRMWVDPVSASFLEMSDARCEIMTHDPNALSRRDAEKLAARIEPIVLDSFPDLAFDPDVTLGDGTVSRGWMRGEAFTNERRGVVFFAYPEMEDGAGSSLTLFYPDPPD